MSYADVGSHPLKGKAEPVPLWAARAVVATAGGAQRTDGLEAPLVGLDRELRMVKEAYHRAEESERASLLVVAGDAGMGKSRLGWEFSKYTDGLSTACRWHAGRCVSYGEGVAYYALAEAVRSRLETGNGHDDEPVDTDALVERGLAAYVEDADERAWLAPRLGALLGTSVTSTFQRDDLYAAWTTFFERVGEGVEPVVMLIDDAQYADEGLIQFIEHLLAAASFPCFVVMLARPELLAEHPDLVTNRRSTVLHIDALTVREMTTLMDGLVDGLPTDVRDVLVERAEGIPTYAVETVRALIDRDLVVPRGGAYVLADPDGLDLDDIGAPTSLQALISARLDRLTASRAPGGRPRERGRGLGRARAARRAVRRRARLSTHVLADLVRAQIFTVDHDRLSSEQGRYQFVQSAVRQIAYATLSRRERKQTHLLLLETMTRETTPELAPMAAEHAMAAMQAAPGDPDAARAHGPRGRPAPPGGGAGSRPRLADRGRRTPAARVWSSSETGRSASRSSWRWRRPVSTSVATTRHWRSPRTRGRASPARATTRERPTPPPRWRALSSSAPGSPRPRSTCSSPTASASRSCPRPCSSTRWSCARTPARSDGSARSRTTSRSTWSRWPSAPATDHRWPAAWPTSPYRRCSGGTTSWA